MVSEWYFEWYFGFCVPFSGIEWYHKLPLRVYICTTESCWNIIDAEWYSMVFNGIPFALFVSDRSVEYVFLSCKAVFFCTKARRSSLYRRNLVFWLLFSGMFTFKMLRTLSHQRRTIFSFPFSMMALANAGLALARRQRHNAFLSIRADMSNDGCDYEMFCIYILGM